MLKIIVKLLMPIALVLAALFGYTVGIGTPSYLLLFFTILVFFIEYNRLSHKKWNSGIKLY